MIKKQLFFAVFCAFAFLAKSQTVSLFAGSQYVTTNWYAYSGNTSSISQTKDSFTMPWGICNDTTGKFWINDLTKMYILSGGFSIVRGGFTGSPSDPGAEDYANATGTVSRFSQPHGICVHPKTNDVYICDYNNNVIRKGSKFVNIPNPSIWSLVAGVQKFLVGAYKDGTTAAAKFNGPEDIVVTSDGGTFYVSDQMNFCIRKINGGNVSTIVGDTIEGDNNASGKSARFSYPAGLFLENDNSLLVCDRNNGKIKRVNLTNNSVSTVVSGLYAPTDVVSVGGILYIADRFCIRTWDGNKLRLYAGKYAQEGYVNGNDSTARFRDLALLTYDGRTKSLYVADMGNNVFRKIPVIAVAVADFWANKTAVSVNEVVTLHNSSVYGNSYSWTISPSGYTLENGSKLTDSMLYVSFGSTGSYTVSLTATNAAGNNTKTKNNYINVSLVSSLKPSTDFIANKTSCTTADTVNLIDQSGNSPTSWTWSFTPSTVTYLSGTTSTSRFPKVKFTASGLYSVTLTAGNTNGTVGKTRTNYISVSPAVSTFANQIHTAGIYPNPATGTIYFTTAPAGNLLLTDLNGKTELLQAQNASANIQHLAPGVYFVRFEDANGKAYAGKFVKLAD